MEDFSFTFKFLSTLPTINSPTIKANKNSVTAAQERLHLQDCECSVCAFLNLKKFTREGFYIYRCLKKLLLQCHLIVNSPPMLSLQNNKFKKFSEDKARMRMRAHAFIQENQAIQGIHTEELTFLSP